MISDGGFSETALCDHFDGAILTAMLGDSEKRLSGRPIVGLENMGESRSSSGTICGIETP